LDVPNRKPERVIIAVLSIVFVIWSAAFIFRSSFIAVDGKRYFSLFDDAMISMRYAWNFSHGLGLVWNPGERIEGYTNLLMTLLMSFATLIFNKSNAVLVIQVSGAVFMLAIAYVSMRIADHITQDEGYPRQGLVRVLVFFCVLFYYPLAYWSLMGMETGLLTLLLLLGVLSAFNYTKTRNPSNLFWVAGYLGLAFLTRNDSIIFALLIMSYIFWETFKQKTDRKILWQLLATIGLYFLFVVGQLVFQYLYYGEWLPNTYTLKLSGMPLLVRIKGGIGFVTPFLIVTAFILVLSSLDLIFDFTQRKLVLLSLGLSAIAYQIYVGGDPWNYWRIMSPTMPLLIILFISAINAVIHAISNTQIFSGYFLRNPIFPRKYMAGALVITFTLIGMLSANRVFLPEISLVSTPYQASANQKNVQTALAINQLTTSDASIGILWAGSIPYYTDRRAIDFLGKSDRYIANLPPDLSGKVSWSGMKSVPGHNKYDLNYSIKTLKPTYVQDFKWGQDDLSKWSKTNYVLIKYDGVFLSLLKDSPAVLWGKINAH
jgi:hypothetical protein